MLEAALTVVDGCPAGAAAVVPEGVQAAVVLSEDAAWRCRQRYTHREKQEDAGKAVICMWPCILSSFKFIVHIRVLFPAFFSYISCFSEVAKAEGFLGTRDQK